VHHIEIGRITGFPEKCFIPPAVRRVPAGIAVVVNNLTTDLDGFSQFGSSGFH